ncbi:hypothetical protein GPECTOR_7g1234 [Gonium pectorale]|uniref:tRNA (adenine(58)-N(1))-methyltransferase non-catalytic subunit TRM6 n=1 Tax=Gonium pectorale TaxID=33097 RepID=A0A150GVG9_GONPE|nr:hypothetical protein GPECTOR_7g1234 [Gonium pectorale]|eukprot:KXZ53340.1 hypothetical protein GPECTOR_7g1234 [Gonium pectorale]
MAADGLMQEGDHLVLDVNGEKVSFVQKLKANGTIRVGKYNVPAAPLVGAPYGSLFEVTADGKSLQRVLLPPDDGITRITETERDNSAIFDRNTENQKLTHEEIRELKASGKAGKEIIDALCSNSATFQTKTEFSQDKYKRRKAKKYLTYVTVRKPTARIVCEAFYDKQPERVWHLRHDSLAIMLSLANVAAGARVLVVEHCMGVVTAAAVERLGGLGAVCALQLDERQAPLDAVRQMNLDAGHRSVLFTALTSSMLKDRALAVEHAAAAATAPARAAVEMPAVPPAADAVVVPQAMDVDSAPQEQPAAEGTSAAAGGEERVEGEKAGHAGQRGAAEAEGGDAGPGPSSEGQRQQRGKQQKDGGGAGGAGGGGGGGYGSFRPRPEVLNPALESGFDSCLVAHPKCHPTALLAAIWPLLAPSATFAVFCPWSQPLAEALSHLQASRNAVLLQVQESWLRPYQVLPARTHPEMTCSGTGGFILSGIKVVPPEATPLEEQLQQQLAGGGPTQWQPARQRAAAAAAAAASAGGEATEAKPELEQEDAAGGAEREAPNGGGGRGGGRGRGRDGGWRGRGGGRGGRSPGRGGRGKRKAEDGEGRAADTPDAKRQA